MSFRDLLIPVLIKFNHVRSRSQPSSSTINLRHPIHQLNSELFCQTHLINHHQQGEDTTTAKAGLNTLNTMTTPYTLYICAFLQAFCFSRYDAFQVLLPSSLPSSYLVNRPSEGLWSLKAKADGDEIPSMNWLTDSLANKEGKTSANEDLDFDSSPYMEEYDVDDDLGDVPIPTTGVSVTDEMEKANKDRFATEVVPIINGLEKGVRAAQLVTSATSGSFEPVRYVVGLSKELSKKEAKDASPELLKLKNTFVMMDVPPYSDQLAANIRAYMGDEGRLAAILVTNRDAIHYDEASAVFTTRNSDFREWTEAFEGINIVAYRLDIPRDCQEFITQRLDGYGPFALQEDESGTNSTFIETGRPLTYEEWDHDITQDIMTRGKAPPDDVPPEENTAIPDEDMYTPEAIRAREQGKRVLAVYTPGHSFGSVSFIFPELELCLSGYTVPVEDNREEENMGMESAGPMLDARGYITTSKAGITRQMESARQLVQTYSDRFTVIMPSRGDPMFLDGDTAERKKALLDLVDQYDKIGRIYEQLGITNFDDDDSAVKK
jgi:hypothetical protein